MAKQEEYRARGLVLPESQANRVHLEEFCDCCMVSKGPQSAVASPSGKGRFGNRSRLTRRFVRKARNASNLYRTSILYHVHGSQKQNPVWIRVDG